MFDCRDVPVLLLTWQRPATTLRVVDAIRAVRPRRLFIASDGPNASNRERVLQVRQRVVAAVDWPCELECLFREENLGCRQGVSTAISWFFDRVDAGMVLEDDVVPDASFFRFCAELLGRYRDEPRVGVISASDFSTGRGCRKTSYSFSAFSHCWGWASWRRAWEHYEHDFTTWPEMRSTGWLENMGGRSFARYWTRCFDSVLDGQVDSWAYIWTYSCWRAGLLTVVPEGPLTTNIGFGEGAVHTRQARVDPIFTRPARPIAFPLRHPGEVARDVARDDEVFRNAFAGTSARSITARLRARTLRAMDRIRGSGT